LPRRDFDAAEVALAQARSLNEQAQRQLADLKRLGKEQALKAAQGSRMSAEGKYRAAEAQLSYSEIRSPIDGYVTERPLYVGDLATANQPILTVMDTSRLIAKSHIPQSEAAVLKAGNPAELKVPGLDEPVKGRVTLVSPALDPGSTTIEVWVEASKPDPALKPGMTVEVAMTAKTVKEALVVPTPAVFKNNEGADYVVIAASDGHAHQKTIQLGVRNAEFSQVLSGVAAGDPIISSGGYALPDNTQIKIEASGAEEKEAGDKIGDEEKDKKSAEAKPAKKGKE
jgi:HlyD family secretion protein